jgi:hypothetical protein
MAMHTIHPEPPRRKSGAMYFLGRPAHVWTAALSTTSRRLRRRTAQD